MNDIKIEEMNQNEEEAGTPTIIMHTNNEFGNDNDDKKKEAAGAAAGTAAGAAAGALVVGDADNNNTTTDTAVFTTSDNDIHHHHHIDNQNQNDTKGKEEDTLQQHSTVSNENTNSNIQKVIRFLQHPAIINLSPSIKETYLHSQNISNETIQLALKQIVEKDDDNDDDDDGKLNKNTTIIEQRNGKNMNTDDTKKNQKLNYTWNNNNNDDYTNSRSNEQQHQQQQHQQQQHQQQQTPLNDQHNQNNTKQNYSAHNPYSQQQQQSYPPPPHVPELPNPFVPMTIGGLITMFGLATYRWINGGDFVLFPQYHLIQPNSTTTTQEEEERKGNEDDVQQFIPNIPENNNIHNNNNENHIVSSSSLIQAEISEPINELENGIIPDDDDDYDEVNNGHNNQIYHELVKKNQSNDMNIISNDIKNLTLIIEKYVALQERSIKEKADEKAREKTNNAMDFLRNHQSINNSNSSSSSSSSSSSNRITPNGKNGDENNNGDTNNKSERNIHLMNSTNAIDIATLIQITELKCTVKEITNQLAVNGGSKEKTDGYNDIATKLETISIYLEKLHDKLSNKEEEDEQVVILEDSASIHPKQTTPASSDSNEKTLVVEDKPTKNEEDMKNLTTSKLVTTKDVEETENVNASIEALKPPCSTEQQEQQSKPPLEPKPTVGKESLHEALEKFQKSNEAKLVKSCAQMMFMYTSNLSSNPNSNQYRKIYTNSKTFKNKVSNVEFAKDILLSIGFVEEGNSFLEWKNYSNVEEAQALVKDAATLLNKLKRGESVTSNEGHAAHDIVDKSSIESIV